MDILCRGALFLAMVRPCMPGEYVKPQLAAVAVGGCYFKYEPTPGPSSYSPEARLFQVFWNKMLVRSS